MRVSKIRVRVSGRSAGAADGIGAQHGSWVTADHPQRDSSYPPWRAGCHEHHNWGMVLL